MCPAIEDTGSGRDQAEAFDVPRTPWNGKVAEERKGADPVGEHQRFGEGAIASDSALQISVHTTGEDGEPVPGLSWQ